MSTEPELIQSPLSQSIMRDGHALQVDIYRLEDEVDWVLEVVNETGTSHVWDDRFATDQAALDAVHEAIDEEGLNPPTIHSANRIADSGHSHALCCQSVESVTGVLGVPVDFCAPARGAALRRHPW